MNDLNITVEQYQDAIKNTLSERQRKVLEMLYAFPDSTATAQELAEVINPQNPSPIIASGQIGKIGKAIATYLGVMPGLYFNGEINAPAYFSIVGEYYSSKEKLPGKRAGWEMNENLKEALQNLHAAR